MFIVIKKLTEGLSDSMHSRNSYYVTKNSHFFQQNSLSGKQKGFKGLKRRKQSHNMVPLPPAIIVTMKMTVLRTNRTLPAIHSWV